MRVSVAGALVGLVNSAYDFRDDSGERWSEPPCRCGWPPP